MSDAALMLVDYAARTVTATAEVELLRDEALALSGLIGRVSNPDEQKAAVEAQVKLASYLKRIEAAESVMKRPLNDLRNQIGLLSKALRADADAEGNRLARLVGEYQELERVKAEAAKKAQLEEISALERERAAALAGISDLDQKDQIEERFDKLVRGTVMEPIAVPRVEGQVVNRDWEVTVKDVYALLRAHPTCVKILPLIGEIKELLNLGVTSIPGVEWKPVTNAGVRLKPERKAIEI